MCFHCTSHIHFNQAPKVNHLFMLNSNEHVYQLLIIEILILLNSRAFTASGSFKASKKIFFSFLFFSCLAWSAEFGMKTNNVGTCFYSGILKTKVVGIDYSYLFVCLIQFFTSHQQSFSLIGTGLPGLNQY